MNKLNFTIENQGLTNIASSLLSQALLVLAISLVSLISCAGGAKTKDLTAISTETQEKSENENKTTEDETRKNTKMEATKKSVKEASVKTAEKLDPVIENVKKVVLHYQKSKSIKMSVDKEVYLSYLEQTKSSKGKLLFSKGRLRLEIEEPEKSLLLMAKNTIWVENHLSADMGGVQVTKINASKQLKQKNALLAFLFDNIKVWDNFEVLDSKIKDKLTAVSLKPKPGQDLGEVVKINLLLDMDNKILKKIVYWDELENKTEFAFSSIDFKAPMNEKLFSYTPPKGATVTTL